MSSIELVRKHGNEAVSVAVLPKHTMARRDISAAAKNVLTAIASFQNADAEAWPSIPTIADRCGLSHRQVQRHIDALEQAGAIEVEERFKDGSLVPSANLYRVSFDPSPCIHPEGGDGVMDVTTPPPSVTPPLVASVTPPLVTSVSPQEPYTSEPSTFEPDRERIGPALSRGHHSLTPSADESWDLEWSPKAYHVAVAAGLGLDLEDEQRRFTWVMVMRGIEVVCPDAFFAKWLKDRAAGKERREDQGAFDGDVAPALRNGTSAACGVRAGEAERIVPPAGPPPIAAPRALPSWSKGKRFGTPSRGEGQRRPAPGHEEGHRAPKADTRGAGADDAVPAPARRPARPSPEASAQALAMIPPSWSPNAENRNFVERMGCDVAEEVAAFASEVTPDLLQNASPDFAFAFWFSKRAHPSSRALGLLRHEE